MAVKPVPEGYHTVTPFLTVKGAAKLIDFLKEAFGGQEAMQMPRPSGEIMHAEVRIGDSVVIGQIKSLLKVLKNHALRVP